jgi:hypothetical protein
MREGNKPERNTEKKMAKKWGQKYRAKQRDRIMRDRIIEKKNCRFEI